MKIHFEKHFPVINNLQEIFVNDVPLIDVRAPVEFTQGAFSMAQNLPLIDDDERHQIGIKYKESGQDEAVQLGAELIDEKLRTKHIDKWRQFISQHPEGLLYCFRGGMRSKISQQWIYEATGVKYPRVQGGYKAMRRFLIESSERLIENSDFILLGGRTGSGKTRLLPAIRQSIDLEGLANHRGSAFGANATPQPTQINFENNFSVQQLKRENANYRSILLEDEGRNIGGVHLPKLLHDKMSISPIIMLQISDEERLQTSIKEYAIDMLMDFQNQLGEEQGFIGFKEALLGSLGRIQKRLGGERYQTLKKLAEKALSDHEKTGNTEKHIPWVSTLLSEYYDPMYDYQIEQKKHRITFMGNQQEVLEYIDNLEAPRR